MNYLSHTISVTRFQDSVFVVVVAYSLHLIKVCCENRIYSQVQTIFVADDNSFYEEDSSVKFKNIFHVL